MLCIFLRWSSLRPLHSILKLIAKQNAIPRPLLVFYLITLQNLNTIGTYANNCWRTLTATKYTVHWNDPIFWFSCVIQLDLPFSLHRWPCWFIPNTMHHQKCSTTVFILPIQNAVKHQPANGSHSTAIQAPWLSTARTDAVCPGQLVYVDHPLV